MKHPRWFKNIGNIDFYIGIFILAYRSQREL
jgi:hypothetical protein